MLPNLIRFLGILKFNDIISYISLRKRLKKLNLYLNFLNEQNKERKQIKINVLDCTLRDGGYYNNWDFPTNLVSKYLFSLSQSKIDYVELGFRFLNLIHFTPIMPTQLIIF